ALGLITTEQAPAGTPGNAIRLTFSQRYGSEVARRRDELQQSLETIATDLGVGVRAVHAAYRSHHLTQAEAGADTARLYDLARGRRISLPMLTRIRQLLAEGRPVNEIVAEVGCSKVT